VITKTVPHEEHPSDIWLVFFQHKGASANIAWLEDKRDTAYLYDLFSTNRRTGEASELLREIDQFCLDHDITLIVEAVVFDNGPDGIQTNEELKTWYEKNGAIFLGYDDEEHPILLLGNHTNWE